MDEPDNLSIQALYAERVEGRTSVEGRPLEAAVTELGFDRDDLFAVPKAAYYRLTSEDEESREPGG